MNKYISYFYHHLPEGMKRRIRLYTYSYNDVVGGKRSKFKDRIDRVVDDFLSDEEKCDQSLVKSIKKDIRRCWLRFGSSPEEYFLFGFRNIPDDEKSTFCTDYEKDMTMKRIMGLSIFSRELLDKYNFYGLTSPFFGRKVFKVTSDTKENDFVEFAVSVRDIFVKPDNLSRGRGAHRIIIEDLSAAKKEFQFLIECGGDWMVEEAIIQCDEMAAWNQSSVNTVRIPTFLNKNGFFVGVPFFRTGRAGSCVDNAGMGGIFADVDAVSGLIYTDGIDEYGHHYVSHPDSGMCFKGYQIPRWKDLLNTVEKVHKECMSHHIYIGWDFALTDKGWVLIEGNWGQFVSQYADLVGFRDKFIKYMNAGFYEGRTE